MSSKRKGTQQRNAYSYLPGRSIKNVNAQSVGRELERLRSEYGRLTPEIVVKAAENEQSPLHAAFEWDDTEAAAKWREVQARKLIVSIRVISSPNPLQKVPAYVSVVHPHTGRSYTPTMEVLDDEGLRQEVLAELRRYIDSLERRYANIEAVVSMLAEIRANVG